MKGLMKAAYYDPNPVVIFEHKGLYWSKVKGTDAAMTVEPDEDYVIPIGKGRIALEATKENQKSGNSIVVVTYGMGVHWALNAAKKLKGQIEIIDLRSLAPIDKELIYERVKSHNKCLIITEEPDGQTFARGLAGLVQDVCFESLDAPVKVLAAKDVPAIPLNSILEETMLPNADKALVAMQDLLDY
jgi:2-oxoisovalerate dehydrogenase E1 component